MLSQNVIVNEVEVGEALRCRIAVVLLQRLEDCNLRYGSQVHMYLDVTRLWCYPRHQTGLSVGINGIFTLSGPPHRNFGSACATEDTYRGRHCYLSQILAQIGVGRSTFVQVPVSRLTHHGTAAQVGKVLPDMIYRKHSGNSVQDGGDVVTQALSITARLGRVISPGCTVSK